MELIRRFGELDGEKKLSIEAAALELLFVGVVGVTPLSVEMGPFIFWIVVNGCWVEELGRVILGRWWWMSTGGVRSFEELSLVVFLFLFLFSCGLYLRYRREAVCLDGWSLMD